MFLLMFMCGVTNCIECIGLCLANIFVLLWDVVDVVLDF